MKKVSILLLSVFVFVLSANAKTTYKIPSNVDYRVPSERSARVPAGTPNKPSAVANKSLSGQSSSYKKYEELSKIKPFYKSWNTIKAYNKVNTVGQRLLESSGLPQDVVFSIASKRGANAYTTAQDEIVLYTGILKYVETEDELAAVIGHELGHVLKKDVRQKIIRRSTLGVFGLSGIDSKIDRNQEYSADIASADILVNAGYNPLAEISILNKITGHYNDSASSHPTGRKRINNLYNYINTYYPEYTEKGYPTVSYQRALKIIGK